jgi:hypothetical protein
MVGCGGCPEVYRCPSWFSVVWVNRYGLPAGYVSRWRDKNRVAPRLARNLVCLKTLVVNFCGFAVASPPAPASAT